MLFLFPPQNPPAPSLLLVAVPPHPPSPFKLGALLSCANLITHSETKQLLLYYIYSTRKICIRQFASGSTSQDGETF
jgi:hypothetical protein